MNDFQLHDNELWCEEVPIRNIAEDVGTPFYLYSHRTLCRHYQVFDEAFRDVPHIVCFSAKANSNVAILRTLTGQGSGVDIVSGGELFRALKAGADPRKIVYSGVGKRQDEIAFALESGILLFNIESFQELEVIDEIAGRMGLKAPVAIRVNPDVDPMTHPHISTGLKENKFGIQIEQSLETYRKAAKLRNVDPVGVDCHIGSQITDITPFLDALDRLKKLIGLLRNEGIAVRYLDLGGGLGITYNLETPPHPSDYAGAIIKRAGDLGLTFILEPGRVIVGNAGILVTRVLYTKSNEDKNFVIIDAGMNDLIRPSLYGSYHFIQPVLQKPGEKVQADIVGPICESGDFLAKKRMLPAAGRGDLLAIMSAGAYGFTMASNYNSRPRAAEVLVRDREYFVIREREAYDDLVRGEHIPAFLPAGR
ncbi:MAG TPA: diaminopimelate decarboxylase [Syntrophales bacterium]|nr:diaminopimelate decarboxylase [Syntrophales bacterium]HQQ27322.1 diaminopimelate decarboxylase [Syntrophales bacterium]